MGGQGRASRRPGAALSARAAARRCAALAGVVAATLLLAEAALRLFDPIGIGYYFETARYFDAMVPDPDFGYLHAPSWQSVFQATRVSFNRHGLRWPEVDVEKRPGARRLLVVGDSVVFGWGAPQDSIFAARVQRALAARCPQWEVIAAGAGSWNTRNEVEFVRKRGLDFSPDALLLFIVSNDVTPSAKGRAEVARERLLTQGPPRPRAERIAGRVWAFAARRSYAAAAVRHLASTRSAGDALRARYRDGSPAVEDARLALSELRRLCDARGTRVFAILYGERTTPLDAAFLDAYEAMLSDAGIEHAAMARLGDDPALRNSAVDRHPNARGHAVIAEAVLAFLRPRLPACGDPSP